MSLFHKLQDVYFDTLKLADELEKLPPKCDCCDENMHRAGKCCCTKPETGKTFSNVTGCLKYIKELRQMLQLFNEDEHRANATLHSGEVPGDASRQLGTVLMLKNSLATQLLHIEDHLNQPESKCAHAFLDKIHKLTDTLRTHAAKLNQVL